MSIIASAGKNTVPGRGKSRSSKLSERHRVRKQNPRKSWVIRDMDGASEGEIESHLKRSKRYFTVYILLKIILVIVFIFTPLYFLIFQDHNRWVQVKMILITLI